MGIIKKQSVQALVLILMIPLIFMLGGILSSLINPEIAAGHPNYARNYHLLHMLKIGCFLASIAGVAVLWLFACLLVIRSKKQSRIWLFLAPLGPFGFAVLAILNDRAPAETDSYARFLSKMNWFVRGAYELATFLLISELAYDAMYLKRTLMIWHQSATTGVSTAQIIDIQNASSGMWAFGEGMEILFFEVLFYLLRPILFSIVAQWLATMKSPKTS